MEDNLLDPEIFLRPLIEVFTWMLNSISVLFLITIEALAEFLTIFFEDYIGQFFVFLVVVTVVFQILHDIYEANFGKDSVDKIMENKDTTGFFHPENVEKSVEEEMGILSTRKPTLWFTEPNFDVTIEPKTVIKFTDEYCGNCNNPINKDDVFCGYCGMLLEEAKAKFLLENSWEKNVK